MERSPPALMCDDGMDCDVRSLHNYRVVSSPIGPHVHRCPFRSHPAPDGRHRRARSRRAAPAVAPRGRIDPWRDQPRIDPRHAGSRNRSRARSGAVPATAADVERLVHVLARFPRRFTHHPAACGWRSVLHHARRRRRRASGNTGPAMGRLFRARRDRFAAGFRRRQSGAAEGRVASPDHRAAGGREPRQ